MSSTTTPGMTTSLNHFTSGRFVRQSVLLIISSGGLSAGDSVNYSDLFRL